MATTSSAFRSFCDCEELLLRICCTLAEAEQQIEGIRRTLKENSLFDPENVFRVLDRSGDGQLTGEDFVQFLNEQNFHLTAHEARQLVFRITGLVDEEVVCFPAFRRWILPRSCGPLTSDKSHVIVDEGWNDIEQAVALIVIKEVEAVAYLGARMPALIDTAGQDLTILFSLLVDGTGYITDSSLELALKSRGFNMDARTRELLFYRLDRDGDGQATYQDFLSMFFLPHLCTARDVNTAEMHSLNERAAQLGSSLSTQCSGKKFRKIRTATQNTCTPAERLRPGCWTICDGIHSTIHEKSVTEDSARSYLGQPKRQSSASTAHASQERDSTQRNMKVPRCQSAGPNLQAYTETPRGQKPLQAGVGKVARTTAKTNDEPETSWGNERHRRLEEERRVTPYDTYLCSVTSLIAQIRRYDESKRLLENCKCMLARRQDFNILDFWRLFDPTRRGFTTELEIREAMRRIGFTPDAFEVNAFVSRHSLFRNGLLRYSDFTNAFMPKDRRNAERLLNRQSTYRGGFPAPHLIFSKETRSLVCKTLRAAVQVEVDAQRLHYNYAGSRPFALMQLMDIDRSGWLSNHECRNALFACGATPKEVEKFIRALCGSKSCSRGINYLMISGTRH